MKKKIVIFASTGFLGSECVKHFLACEDYEVFTVNRKKIDFPKEKQFLWDGETLGNWQKAIDSCDIVLNFAGRSVNCRYNKKNREEIYNSRILSTKIIGEAIQKSSTPPKIWLNASTSTIYRESFDKIYTEEKGEFYSKEELKNKFSEYIAYSWEETFNNFELISTRKILLRTSMIYGANAPLYKILRKLTLLGLGGKQYPFNQYISWMHILDYCRACQHLIEHKESHGAYNMSTAFPEKNEDFMKIFANVLGKKIRIGIKSMWFLKVVAFLWKTEAILISKSRYVSPQKLLDEGFKFKFPKIKEAFTDIKG